VVAVVVAEAVEVKEEVVVVAEVVGPSAVDQASTIHRR
jgi:hypothetical protein